MKKRNFKILSLFFLITFSIILVTYYNLCQPKKYSSDSLYSFYTVDSNGTKKFSDEMPTDTNTNVIVSCDNGAIGTWDYEKWGPTIKMLQSTNTKCVFNFVSKEYTLVKYIKELVQTDKTNLVTDDYNNIRYIGADPNNYVSFDGDIWRIIGVIKNVDDGNGTKEDRVKIIRNSSIGSYSWDSSDSSVNSGAGINEWSQADLMKLLNSGYESEAVGGSLYWNNKSGTCYSDQNNGTKACDFTSIGIKDSLKSMLGDAVWNTGSQGKNDYSSTSNGLVKNFYTYERSTNTGKNCTSGSTCNDKVERTTSWKGLLGLMYPSDYGYATSGGTTTDRATCLNTNLNSWNSSSVSDCHNNDWLFNNVYKWTLMPSSSPTKTFFLKDDGSLPGALQMSQGSSVSSSHEIFPTGYLISDVTIKNGDGSLSNPFILEI